MDLFATKLWKFYITKSGRESKLCFPFHYGWLPEDHYTFCLIIKHASKLMDGDVAKI